MQQARDVIEELPRPLKEKLLGVERPAEEGKKKKRSFAAAQPMFAAVELSADEQKVFDLLSADVPAHIDQLLLSSLMQPTALMTALLGLEMKDRIRELPGKSFIKRL